MIPGLSPANEQFVTSVENLQSQLTNTQNQLSTGLRVNQASDDPQEVGDIFETRADLGNVNQTIQNLNNVQAQVNAGDTSLQSAVQLLQNAGSLATEGLSTSATADEQSSLATQVQSILSQLVGLSQTQVNGVYIFSGDASGSPPYQLDPTSPTGVDQLVTAQDTQQIADPTGLTFQIGMTAQQLFDNSDANGNPTPQNAFAAVNSLQLALQNGDTNGISQALDSLQSASGYLNQQLGFYGAVQNRISSAIDLANKFQVQDQTQLSNLQDTDVPTAALQLTQESTEINAAMSAQARIPTTTLFDYLPIST
jgi:flagellar hook-associated protein 3 FlgL